MSTAQLELAPEIETLKARLKATWTAGDFGQVAKTYSKGAAEFVTGLELKPGEHVLDVACGTGNQAIPAARAGARVVGIDIVPNLIEQARSSAEQANLNIRFDEGDAEQLPYADGTFDTIISMFGAMFAPRPEKVVGESLRVCRPGGRIVMANWTPEGFIGQMFQITAGHAPPPRMPSPLFWGNEDIVRERFQSGIQSIQFKRHLIEISLPMAPYDTVEFFRLYYGPTQRAFAALGPQARVALRRELESHWERHNQASGDDATSVNSEYLEVVAVRSQV